MIGAYPMNATGDRQALRLLTSERLSNKPDQILQGDEVPFPPRKLEQAEDAKCHVSGSASVTTECPLLADNGCLSAL